jgi:hypothetical protein
MTPITIRLSKIFLLCLFSINFFYGSINCPAQVSSFYHEIDFVSHLQDNSEFRNSIYCGLKIDTTYLSSAQKDSLNYYLGWAAYNIKKLDASALQLSHVTGASPLFAKSVFYSANNYSYLNKYQEAILEVRRSLLDTHYRQLSYTQMAAVHLLERNYIAFDSASSFFYYAYFNLAPAQK